MNAFPFCQAMGLKVVKRPVYATVVEDKTTGKSSIVPFDETSTRDESGKVFFYGYGYKKILKKKTIQVPNLPESYTAKDIQQTFEKYGFNVVLGLLETPWNYLRTMYDDAESSATLNIQSVLMNICINGDDYLNTMKTIYEIGNRFIDKVIAKFHLQSTLDLNDFESFRAHELRKILENAKPLSYIEHYLLMTRFFCTPSFNSIDFDKGISFLCRDQGIKIDENNCSTRDMIVMLSDEDSAKEVESIFDIIEAHNDRARINREEKSKNPTLRPSQLIM